MLAIIGCSASRIAWFLAALSAGIWIGGTRAAGEDWPQWLGPRRDSVWQEDGIVPQIPEDGLPVKWPVPVAPRFSWPAVAWITTPRAIGRKTSISSLETQIGSDD